MSNIIQKKIVNIEGIRLVHVCSGNVIVWWMSIKDF